VSSRHAASPRSWGAHPTPTCRRRLSNDQFQRPRTSQMPLHETQGSEERLGSTARAPLSPKVRGCAVAPSLSSLRLDDANLRCEAPSPGPVWSGPEVKNIYPGPCKVRHVLCVRGCLYVQKVTVATSNRLFSMCISFEGKLGVISLTTFFTATPATGTARV
jgi:hypothetical protein